MSKIRQCSTMKYTDRTSSDRILVHLNGLDGGGIVLMFKKRTDIKYCVIANGPEQRENRSAQFPMPASTLYLTHRDACHVKIS